MPKYLKVLLAELAIALVLIIIIVKIPSHRKLKKLNDSSLNYEHAVVAMESDTKEKPADDADGLNEDSRAAIDGNRPKGGYSSFEDGDYQKPEETTTPSPEANDPGTNDPTASDPGTKDPDTAKPDTKDPDTKDPGTKQAENTPTPTPEPAKTTGKTCKVTCEGSVRLRSKPDSRDDHNAVYLAMEGEILDVVSTQVETDDPVTTEWYLVKKQDKKYNRELYVPAKYVTLQ